MEVIYQSIYFLAIGFMAIAIAVFVLAVSLLGRAIKISVNEQIEAEKKLKVETEKEIERIQEQLGKAKSEERIKLGALVKSLDKLKSKDSKHERTLWWIRFKPKLLTAKWGAIIPGVLFLFSIVCNIFALYYYGALPNIANTFCAISIVPFIIGVLIIATSLKAIESVAITSDETIAVREKETFKAAMIEIEETKRPKLGLVFKGQDFPLSLYTETEVNIEVKIVLENGEFAEDVKIFFYFPPSFGLSDSHGIKFGAEHEYPNYIGVRWEKETIMRGLEYQTTINFKTPNDAGKYKMVVYSFCKGSWTYEPAEYEIIVEEELPF